MTIKTALIIPARYASTRLPGKPLVKISGQTMLSRVVAIARAAAKGMSGISVCVATDDDRIEKHCHELNVDCARTSPDCPTGTDRLAEAVTKIPNKPDFIMNVQGDAPLTPPDFLRAMIESFVATPTDVVTPVVQMSWEHLDKLRADKIKTPFSGTCAVFDETTGNAFWFSKNIIPAIRNEGSLRVQSALSPIFRHVGLYGYSRVMLEKYVTLPQSHFENLEGLEQLRVLENGYKIRCVKVDYAGRASMSGVDSPEDVVRAEKLIAQHGELLPA